MLVTLPAARSTVGRLRPHWKGHLLRFGPKAPATYDPASGLRLLLIVLLLEGILGPRLGLLRWFALPVPPPWLRVPLLLGIALALARWFAKVKLSQLGLYSWKNWSKTERSYFIQVFVLANLVFGVMSYERLQTVAATPSLWGSALVVCLTSLLWGFYQELVYRGLLQTELIRRWGSLVGILVANSLYTFGPLHFYHLGNRPSLDAGAMLAAIFAMGLFFALLFKNSGNLWMVGIFHGIGDWYLDGLRGLIE